VGQERWIIHHGPVPGEKIDEMLSFQVHKCLSGSSGVLPDFVFMPHTVSTRSKAIFNRFIFATKEDPVFSFHPFP
jgi:hypothetical protein